MASGVIPKTNIEGGSNYTKLPDGTLLMWGTTQITSGTFVATPVSGLFALWISFNMPTTDAQFIGATRVSGISKMSSGFESSVSFWNCSNTIASGRAYVMSSAAPTLSSSNPLSVEWMAVGRWK